MRGNQGYAGVNAHSLSPISVQGWTLIGTPFTFEGESGRCVTDESVLPRLRVILLAL